MRTRLSVIAGVCAVALLAGSLGLTGAQAAGRPTAAPVRINEYRLDPAVMDQLRTRWLTQLGAKHPAGSWAPMRFELGDEELGLMGLPSKATLLAHRYRTPTTFSAPAGKGGGKDGGGGGAPTSTGVAAVAGAGWTCIRPGAWLLFISGNSIGWCSAAHVYGSPGSYQISTAGHCGKTGDVVTMIGAIGDDVPVLLDIGTISTSHDGGLGNDWALIKVYSHLQSLVTPTMAFWGGPIGMFERTGAVASVHVPRRGLVPEVEVTPDPFLAQGIVHYGHGTGIGAGGTPRSGAAIAWGASHFMFFGAITPGDSGSGSNTLLGDTVGAQREAAGINTHIYVDTLMRQGLGIMGGTRATAVSATLANGQLVPYPAPAPGLP